MTRNLKALGLALVAAFALSAVVASAASADKLVTEGGANVVITGKNTTGAFFGTKGSAITLECSDATYTATGTNNATSLAVELSYNECTDPWDVDRCELTISTNTTSHSNTTGGTETDAPVALDCAAGGEITMTNSLCPITFTAQSGLHGVTFTQGLTENGKNVVEMKLTIDNIAYHAPENFFCEFGGVQTPTGTDGILTGEVLMTGYEDTGSGTTYNFNKSHGATQIGISVPST